jgi:sigma-E factor negative regulatory protein RseC
MYFRKVPLGDLGVIAQIRRNCAKILSTSPNLLIFAAESIKKKQEFHKSRFVIEHQGVIEQINGNHITVKILQQSSCSDCHAKRACISADSKEKRIDIFDSSNQFSVNETVIIEGKESIGYKAVLWAFVIPLIIVVIVLILTTLVWKFSELSSALSAIIALIPYYILLYLLRDKIAKILVFSIKKQTNE